MSSNETQAATGTADAPALGCRDNWVEADRGELDDTADDHSTRDRPRPGGRRDRALADFLDIIEQWLLDRYDLDDAEVERAVQLAKRMKKNQHHSDLRDVEIFSKVVEEAR